MAPPILDNLASAAASIRDGVSHFFSNIMSLGVAKSPRAARAQAVKFAKNASSVRAVTKAEKERAGLPVTSKFMTTAKPGKFSSRSPRVSQSAWRRAKTEAETGVWRGSEGASREAVGLPRYRGDKVVEARGEKQRATAAAKRVAKLQEVRHVNRRTGQTASYRPGAAAIAAYPVNRAIYINQQRRGLGERNLTLAEYFSLQDLAKEIGDTTVLILMQQSMSTG